MGWVTGKQTTAGASGETVDIADAIRRAKAYDRAAFATIYGLSVTPVYRYLAARLDAQVDAEELTQEVFLAALDGIQNLRADDEPALLAWLFQIARHKPADYLRRRYRKPTTALEAETVAAPEQPPEASAEAGEERAALRLALERLTPEQREVIICKYVLDYDNERTARLVGKNANAVNQLHHRALASLQRLMARPERAG